MILITKKHFQLSTKENFQLSMSVIDLISYDSQKVRANSDLLAFYVQTFERFFGYKPNCVGCTFNDDFQRLKNAIVKDFNANNFKLSTFNFKQNKTMKNTFKLRQEKCEILWYRKDDYVFRRYDYALDDEFVSEFLTHGTEQEIAERKKLFSKLPDSIENEEFTLENEIENQAEVQESVWSEPTEETTEPKPKKSPKKK